MSKPKSVNTYFVAHEEQCLVDVVRYYDLFQTKLHAFKLCENVRPFLVTSVIIEFPRVPKGSNKLGQNM